MTVTPGTRSPLRRGWVSAQAVAVGCLLVAACASPAPPPSDEAKTPPEAPQKPLTWTRCGELPGEVRECSTLTVPLEYSDPDGPSIELALARIPARGPGERVGSILVDPGGPGISGVDEILTLPYQLSPAVEARYDIVGWDRRAVGKSSPLWCRTPDEMGDYARALASAQWSTAADSPEVERWAAQARAFSEGCATRNPDLVGHIGTRDSARDMESIRVALGEPAMNYVGWSHGTKLAAFYIDQYPQNVGRMVLDSAIDPSLSIDEYNRGQSQGLEAQLMRFVDYCTAAGDCPLPADHAAATDALKTYLLSLPEASDDPGTATRADAMAALAEAMYIPPDSFPVLLQALRDGLAGDGTGLIDIGGLRAARSNRAQALYAINCYDSTPTPDVAGTAALAGQWNADTPIFGSINAWGGLRCSTFPAHDPIGPKQVRGEGAPPVVVVGALDDGATPIAWSRALAEQLVSARLVVADTDVHSVYPTYNRCVTRIVDDYLLDGVAPPRFSDCPAD
ncbi:MAG TPA: alpha/beta hydrolase [Mycobacterium sp.]|nr:alpha/beta hydrolase [Mycobacterium sp.]HQE14738.1 alpha/beta hydrolase [Mycobacterium sp.]